VTAQPRRGVNLWVLGLGLLIPLPIVALLVWGFGRDPHALPNMLEGRQAPDFALRDIDGNEVSLQALRGKPVVLNFWSTWCQPCKLEHPHLLATARKYGDRVAFYGVIYEDKPAPIRAYLARKGGAYPHLVDPGSRTAFAYWVAGVPETYFINHAGKIVEKVSFPVSQAFLSERLDALLEAAKQ
jgi:cytochrome c biogenesis protein CcmG/thiol:disulfide interchange protein DsbE